ncbi:Crp/Fnr family transcriptional regulator [Mucilaginibacter sabulilitoris]|uniref:Crp/Fnr family transcriptional regulator n=1 Tax=Mucilaginibacter sabulilitoris TaxID=1173583 RepID=A0ABZ0TTD1_9SPHI|nr:Crp/Fnr family transcriptional regulator [Mucilaginibacter sabulilitoris]WPU96332.1 Crp/Fnr family transcriptional regulator [Mucilaginibacter sabulilitoris]
MFDQFKQKAPHLTNRMDAYAGLYERIEVPAKTVLLKEGQVSKRSFFIEKGCLRIWFNNNGRDVTFQFAFENQVISSADSFMKGIPSMFTIEAIEPSVIQVLSKKNFDLIMTELGDEAAFLKTMIDAMFERQLYYMREFLSFIRDTPQQRYINLLKEKPHLIQRIPQHYIASYLGITSVSLSRIRNKVIKEKIR